MNWDGGAQGQGSSYHEYNIYEIKGQSFNLLV